MSQPAPPQPYDPIYIPPEGEPSTAEKLERRRRKFAHAYVQNRDLRPIVEAIRQIQQQLNITPLLRMKLILGPDESDDDS